MLEMLYSRERENLDNELLARISHDVKAGKSVTLLVPEQQVHSAETMLSYNNIMSPELEVVGFRRLCESIFRRFGGLAYNNITDGARLILMWRTLAELSPMLKEYGNIALDDIDMIKSLLASVRELSLYGISPKMLEEQALKTKKDNEKLSRKLEDLSLIAAANSALLKNSYNDPAEDTRRAVETLENNDYFGGRTVYIAHFTAFTVYEKQIIKNIIAKADGVSVFIGMDKSEDREIFDTLHTTELHFLKCASKYGVKVLREQIENNISKKSGEINYFCQNIWNFSAEKYSEKCENIKIVYGESARDEARFVASDIAKKVRHGGVRYRDFAVIVRNTSDYEGIIDRELSLCGIPSFISSRSDIKMRPSVRMILLALKIKTHRWQTEDVISYLRCAFTDIPEDACDKLERYANLWKISGRRWYDEHPWSMHPRGFGAELTDEDRTVLKELNLYRSKLVSPLVKFFEIFGKKPTLREISASLYHFLTDISLREKLEVSAAELRDKGRVSEADETVQLWNCLIASLDSLVTVAGEMRCDSSAYSKLLSTSLEMSDIGKIPSGIDEVVIGEAPSLKVSGVKYVYVMGLNEGIFPAPSREDIILGDRDRRTLSEAGIELSPESTEGARDEMFYFYLAGSAARSELTFTYNKERSVSTFLASVKSLFEDVNEIDISTLPKEDFVWSDMAALEYSVKLKDTDAELAQNIRNYLKERGNIRFFEESDLKKQEYRYTGEKTLFGDYIRLSQSRLESYAMCPFAYFCKYILDLSEAPSSEASSADIGNFIHLFLELFVKRAFGDSESLSNEEITRAFNETLTECERSLGESVKEVRVQMLISRLRNNLSLVAQSLYKEFKSTLFRPKFYELVIGDESLSPLKIELPDGGKVGVYGKVDRVDTFERDGQLYLRVVDYKSGKKTFSRSELAYGLNMQMLLYLESLCKTDDRKFLDTLGLKEDERPVPAAVLYFSTKMPSAEVVSEENVDTESINDDLLKNMKRKGLVIDDKSLAQAMDSSGERIYSPVSLKSNGEYTASSAESLVDSFDELFSQINTTVSELAMNMKSGSADATPLKTDNHDACAWCAMAPVCRRKSYCAEHSEILHGVVKDENEGNGGRE